MRLDALPEGAELRYNIPGSATVPTVAGEKPKSKLIDLPEGADLKYNLPQSETDKAQPDVGQALEASENETIKKDTSLLGDFLTNAKADLENRASEYEQTLKDFNSGKISYPEFVLQAYGKAAFGSFLDVSGEAITTGLKGISFLIPDSVEKPVVDAVTQGLDYIENTELGQRGIEALAEGVDAWSNFKEANPRAAKNIESVVNIGVVLAPVKTKGNAAPKPDATKLSTAADKLRQAANAKEHGERKALALDLTTPKLTEQVRAQRAKRTTQEGVINTNVYQPTARELEIADVVASLPVKTGHSYQKNLNIVLGEAQKMNTSLTNRLKQYTNPIDDYQVQSRIDKSIDTLLTEKLTMVGDEQTAKILNVMADKIDSLWNASDKTPSALLQVRRDFDDWVLSNKGDVFGSEKIDNIKTGTQALRNALNDVLEESVPDANVKQSLRKQHLLLSGADELAVKAGNEAANSVTRLWENVTNLLPFKAETNRLIGAGLGISVGTAAATVAPVLIPTVITGVVAYGAYKGALKLPVRKALATLLSQTDKALKVAKNPDMVKQLRQDRAAIVELLKLPVDKEPTEVTPATEVPVENDLKPDIEVKYPNEQAQATQQRVLGTALQTPTGDTQLQMPGGGSMLPMTSDQLTRAGLSVVNGQVVVQDPVKFSSFSVGL